MNSNKIKILIVEDEALIADEIRRVVDGLGYQTIGICYNYETAATALTQTDADLVLLDINLSARTANNGIALAEMIRSTNPRPFIFLTAYSDKNTITQAAATYPVNYLVKPVNAGALFAAIQLAFAKTMEPALPLHDVDLDFFYIKTGTRKQKLFWKDVYCIEAGKNYVRLFLKDMPGSYPIRGTISFVLDKLVPEKLKSHFFRLGRHYCLNRHHVSSFDEEYITCCGKEFENAGRISTAQFAEIGK